ncbi:hypothetical protein SDC9_198274 [bioreactor metagenome]|uniref:YCII-related domain-containing protein n=1 Tax=bioreactor metagenome TaxID=1076179 RepID=A0A645III2_9ZZZZ
MKYFIVEGTFKETLPVGKDELQKAIREHLAFLQKGLDEGNILVSGPKVDVGGGIIIMKGESQEEIETYLSKDPLKILRIQEYRILEFKVHDCQPMLKEWFGSSL